MGMLEGIYIIGAWALGASVLGIVATLISRNKKLMEWLRCQWWAEPFFID